MFFSASFGVMVSVIVTCYGQGNFRVGVKLQLGCSSTLTTY